MSYYLIYGKQIKRIVITFFSRVSEWLELVFHILEVPASDLRQQTDNPDRFLVVLVSPSRQMPE